MNREERAMSDAAQRLADWMAEADAHFGGWRISYRDLADLRADFERLEAEVKWHQSYVRDPRTQQGVPIAWLFDERDRLEAERDEAQVENARLREARAMSGTTRERTHWEGCWQYATHYQCAVARVVRATERCDVLEAEIARLEAENARLREALEQIAGATVYPDAAGVIPAAMSHMRVSEFVEWAQHLARAHRGGGG
jgi:uncharacterized small protein (DUF1192 family)